MTRIAILTNARAADQRSMIGYGELLLEMAREAGHDVVEWRSASLFSRLAPGTAAGRPLAKLLANVDRFLTTPLALAGRRADLVHVVDPGNVVYADVVRSQARIVTVHDVIPYLCLAGRLVGFHPTATGRWLMAAILRRLPRFDRIVCVSENTRRDLMSLVPLDPARVVTIPNAVFQPMRRAAPDAQASMRRRLGLPAEAPVVLHVGSSLFYKNRSAVLDVFARVAPRHPRASVLFVGPRSDDVSRKARALGLADRVYFAERVPPADLAAVYSLAKALVFPSLYEGFGYPVLEAQMCGVPVVCSDAGSLAEITDGTALTHAASDIDGMARSLDRVLSEDTASLVAAGYRNAHRFDGELWRRRHEHLYQAVCQSKLAANTAGCGPA